MAISRGNSLLMKKQWAEDGSTVIPNPPVAGTTYRDESVDADNIAEGQQYDGVADSARWNQLLYIMTGILKDALAHGILPWLNTQDYAEGAVVMGSNGTLYKSKKATGPTTSNAQDPTSDSGSTWGIVTPVAKPNGGLTLDSNLQFAVSTDGVTIRLTSEGKLEAIPMKGASASANGSAGTVPQPLKGQENKPLRGDGNYGDSLDCDITGNAATANSATKAAQDGAGNIITDTYVRKGTALMPVGSVYVQFAGTADPTSLFGGTWENVSGYFAGLFFRAEGGAAAAFGGSQLGGAPNISGGFRVTLEEYAGVSGCFYIQSQEGNGTDGTKGTNVVYGINAALSSALYGASPNEIRPSNSTIRIWKRIA